ncbi:DNA-3-methyladenine glycosylase family protein [Peribacillus loiseleuriae]|uniref:DNA-3-methyladenine glycosylase family protein n=1 Tax=Peribacillus loiseleuriae TaxID=1679170 RepID=UPI003D064DDF
MIDNKTDSNEMVPHPNLPACTWEDHGSEIHIKVPNEFDYKQNLNYLANAPNECTFHVKGQCIYKALSLGIETLVIEISEHKENGLIIHFLSDSRPEEKWQRAEIARYIREWFDLDYDLKPFYEMAKADPLLKQLVCDFYGLRVLGIPDLFEAFCWGILGQQINLGFAYTLKKQFVEKFGEFIEWNGKKYWMFPSYNRISQLTPADLADIKMTVKKSEYIIGIAQLMANGELSKEKLMKMATFKEVEKRLIKIRGIGPWTANYVLMRCLRFPTAFPIDDVGLINSVKLLLSMDRKPTKEEILELAIPWKNLESYTTFYLWRVLY